MFFVGIWWLDSQNKRLHARQLSTLAAFTCPGCGHTFGQSVAVASRDAHLAQCVEATRQHPNCKINFVRFWPVRCPACFTASEFHYDTLQLQIRNA